MAKLNVASSAGRTWLPSARAGLPGLISQCAAPQILKRINAEIEARRRAGEDLPPPPKTAIAGPEYFGLNQANVRRQHHSTQCTVCLLAVCLNLGSKLLFFFLTRRCVGPRRDRGTGPRAPVHGVLGREGGPRAPGCGPAISGHAQGAPRSSKRCAPRCATGRQRPWAQAPCRRL